MKMFMACYFTDDRHKLESSPLRAETLAGLPATFMATAQLDPLRDEGLAYADRLSGAGVEVETHCYEGLTHNFIVMSHVSRTSRSFLTHLSTAIAKHLQG